ncbi:MAG TPA: DUF1905 domain-containing protein [Rhabdaerophilum sp.]|nr:DUF1905 domain-containing protein [Rhabdaerophilum sp.]
MQIAFAAPLWLWSGKGAWHFITLPQDDSAIIRMAVPRRGWGSVRVRARIGETEWVTSIFPDAKAGAYLLPVKASVRGAEGLSSGDSVTVELALDL